MKNKGYSNFQVEIGSIKVKFELEIRNRGGAMEKAATLDPKSKRAIGIEIGLDWFDLELLVGFHLDMLTSVSEDALIIAESE